MTWVPEDQRDTRWYLWNKKFLCSVRYGDTFTVERLRNQGIYTSGDPSVDRAMMNERTRFYLSINDMVEYFRQGILVGVVNREDTAKIYDYVSNHIAAFRREIAIAWDLKDIPVEDLVLLDQFASTVYEHAKHEFTKEVANSLMARRMDEIVGFSIDNILGEAKNEPVVNAAGEEEVDPYPKRESLENFFNELVRKKHRGF